MQESIKTKKMPWLRFLIDYLILGSILFYLIFLWKHYPFSIGGSFIFICVIGINFYFSIVHKELAWEITLISLLLALMMGLNFMTFIEHTMGFSEKVLIGTISIALTIFYVIWYLMIRPFGPRETFTSSFIRIELWKRITSQAGHLIVSLGFITATAAFFLAVKEESIIKSRVISFSYFVLFWILIGLIIVLTRIRVADAFIPYLIFKKSRVNIITLKKWFFPIALSILIIGSIFEIARGFWLFWFLTWLTFVTAIITVWKTWKHIFIINGDYDINSLKEEQVLQIPFLLEPKYVLKFMGVWTISGLVYLIILLMIWYFYR